MAKYIDAEKIRAEIERRKKENMYYELPMTIGRYYEDRDILALIDSLQQEQPEVDLEKEIHEKALQLHTAPTYEELEKFACHFYELGLKQERRKNNESE